VSRGVDAIDFKWYQNKRNAAQNSPVDFGFGKGGVCDDAQHYQEKQVRNAMSEVTK
jgi:hypothetical protein